MTNFCTVDVKLFSLFIAYVGGEGAEICRVFLLGQTKNGAKMRKNGAKNDKNGAKMRKTLRKKEIA